MPSFSERATPCESPANPATIRSDPRQATSPVLADCSAICLAPFPVAARIFRRLPPSMISWISLCAMSFTPPPMSWKSSPWSVIRDS